MNNMKPPIIETYAVMYASRLAYITKAEACVYKTSRIIVKAAVTTDSEWEKIIEEVSTWVGDKLNLVFGPAQITVETKEGYWVDVFNGKLVTDRMGCDIPAGNIVHNAFGTP